MVPSYICIGAAKAGTMSLIEYLNDHPQISCYPEEYHLFDRTPHDAKLSPKVIRIYEKNLRSSKPIQGEKSPSYCYLPYAISRIAFHYPKIKLIFLLREPVARAYSHFNMMQQRKKGVLSLYHEFEKEWSTPLSQIVQNGSYYVVRGFYDEMIQNIWNHFPKEQVYIGVAEEIRENKLEEYNKIFKFLGADPYEKLNLQQDTHIQTYSRSIPPKLARRLARLYRPHNEKLYQMLGRKIPSWEKYYQQLFQKKKKAK